MFSTIGLLGMWTPAMETFAQVLVATGLAVLIGVALGVAAAESKTVSKIMRPVNDVFQTLPQLVYIIPFVYLMPISYRARNPRERAVRLPGGRPTRRTRRPGRRTGFRRSGTRVRRQPAAGPD